MTRVHAYIKAERVEPVTNSIHRVSVIVEDYQELDLTGLPISVAADRVGFSDRFDLWYEHLDGDRPAFKRFPIWVFGTGHPVPWTALNRHHWHFIGTVVTPAGLVWHVYTGPRLDQVTGLK